MASVNKVILLGNLGKDPETRYTQSGEAVANFSIATTEKWTDKSGAKQEKTEWHNIVLFGRIAEVAGEYLRKGSPVYLEGKMQTRKWQDKSGNDRWTTEVVCHSLQLLGSKPDGPPREERRPPERDSAPSKPRQPSHDDFDDDIPF